jgi:putative transposase
MVRKFLAGTPTSATGDWAVPYDFIYTGSMILRAYKYRLYPTKEQEQFLLQNFGCVRFVWNQLVANFNSWSKDGPTQTVTEKTLKDDPRYPWLKEVISYALQQRRMDFDETKKQFFNKKRAVKLGRMKFKCKGKSRDSFRIPAASLGGMKAFDLDAGTIKLTKMSPMKMVVDRKFNGAPKSVTISRNPSGQYFVSVLVEEELELKPNTGRSIGIDLGLKDLIVMSNGLKISNPRWFRESQSKLKRAQQHLSRKVKGSNRWNKQRIKVAKNHQKITNQRNWFYHNLSTWLVNNYDTICMEKLNVKGMVKNRRLAKSIQDVSWSSFVSMVAYKSNWYGRSFQQIDTFYPSSKLCSCCGHKMASMELSVREWTCPSCGSLHDRDLNAAMNILLKGLDDLYGFTSDELADYRRREELRPKVEMPKASSLKRLVSFIDFYKTT